mmetsp:Transcript_13068/g.16373  ORF Transcript_13068/g.16373 Transcript_13068/m.16373 type:complete len:92 (-) Transcript_13068:401-676(-)
MIIKAPISIGVKAKKSTIKDKINNRAKKGKQTMENVRMYLLLPLPQVNMQQSWDSKTFPQSSMQHSEQYVQPTQVRPQGPLHSEHKVDELG